MFEIAIGGLLFWGLLIALLVACEFSTVNENHWSFGWLIIFASLLAYFSTFNPFIWMLHNPGGVAIYSGIYIAIGICWGFVKWAFYLHNEKDRIQVRLDSLRANYNQDSQRVANPFTGTFTDWLERQGKISRATDNKELISVWMLWWPFSLLWSMFNDALRRFYNWAIEQYMYIFDKINKMVFGSLNN